MFKSPSKKLVNIALQRNIIQQNDVEECVYGINTFFTIALNIITIFIVGLLTHMLIEIALYIVIFKSLRRYVGGSHSSTALKCYISSFITYTASILVIKYYPLPEYWTMIIALLSAAIMFLFAPVEAIKKPLDDLERRVFKKRAYIRIIICLMLFILIYFLTSIPYIYDYSVVIMISMLTVAIFTVSGKIQLVSFQNSLFSELK